MQTHDILEVLQHVSDSSPGNARDVLRLKDEYPFSQVLHALSARLSRDHNLADSASCLQLAAVYSADRSVLKEVMEGHSSREERPSKEYTSVAETKSEEIDRQIATSNTVDINQQLLDDMEQLRRAKENFELLFADDTSSSKQYTAPPQEKGPESTEEAAEQRKSKKERIVELAKSLSGGPSDAHSAVTATFREKRRKKDPTENLIEQIVVSKEELSPESEKQKEQIEIIDHFIRVQPTITGSKDRLATANDLSTIKSGEFADNIISETLVEILLKQGKKDKAVEVLKKLIWKFPQKKAYFASQIEELRK